MKLTKIRSWIERWSCYRPATRTMPCRVRVGLVGEVQGVGLRWRLSAYARQHGLGGWIMNRPDGTVVAEIEGDEPPVRAAAKWLAAGAGVTRVDQSKVEEVPLMNETTFQILR